MIDFATLAGASPVVVCGNPRSGTRMHANALNAHPEVLITDEFHGIQHLHAFLSDFRTTRLKTFSPDRALARQNFLAKMFWLSCSIDRTLDRGLRVQIIGNKTPQIERHYRELERIFLNAPPKYVYCLRSAPKVLRSVKNFPNLRWNRDSVETNLARYIRSVRCMEEMRATFPERVCVSMIEHLKPGMTNGAFFARVFDFVGVTLTDAVGAKLNAMNAQNTLAQLKPGAKAIELSDAEMTLIARSRDYAAIRERYGLDPV
jgi:hypothetical protein